MASIVHGILTARSCAAARICVISGQNAYMQTQINGEMRQIEPDVVIIGTRPRIHGPRKAQPSLGALTPLDGWID